MKLPLGVMVSLVLAGCGGVSDALPASQVSAKAGTVVRVSTLVSSTLASESVAAIAAQMAKSKIPQVVMGSGLVTLNAASIDPAANPALQAFDESMAQLREAGASTIWFVVDEADGVETLSQFGDGPNDGLVWLVQTDGRMGAGQLAELATKLLGSKVDATSVGGGWFRITDPSASEAPAITDPSPENATALQASAMVFGQSTVSCGMLVTPAMRASWQDGMAESNPMLAGIASGFGESIDDLQALSVGVDLGPSPAIRGQFRFSTPDAANEFADEWSQACDGMAMMAGMMLAAPKEDGSPSVDPKVFRSMAEALRFKQAESSLNLTIDGPVWPMLIP